MTNEDEKGYNENIEAEVSSQEIIVNESDVVTKIIWETSIGKVTWKPKLKRKEYRGALEVQSTIQPCVGDLPEKIVDIAKAINSKGKVKMSICYAFWKTTKDNQEVTYRFLNSSSQLDKWQLIEEKQENIS